MADVQMVLSWWLGCFALDLPVCVWHTQLTSLGKRLKVVGRHCPEMKVWIVSKQPAVDHNICLAGSARILPRIPFIILWSSSLMNSLPSHAWLPHRSPPSIHPPHTFNCTSVARLPYHIINGIQSCISGYLWEDSDSSSPCRKNKYILGTFQVNHRCNKNAERREWDRYSIAFPHLTGYFRFVRDKINTADISSHDGHDGCGLVYLILKTKLKYSCRV